MYVSILVTVLYGEKFLFESPPPKFAFLIFQVRRGCYYIATNKTAGGWLMKRVDIYVSYFRMRYFSKHSVRFISDSCWELAFFRAFQRKEGAQKQISVLKNWFTMVYVPRSDLTVFLSLKKNAPKQISERVVSRTGEMLMFRFSVAYLRTIPVRDTALHHSKCIPIEI